MRQVNGAERESYHICCTYLKMGYSEIPLNKNKNRFIGGYLSSGTMVTITCCFHLLLSQIDFGASINFNIAVNTRTVQPIHLCVVFMEQSILAEILQKNYKPSKSG